MDDKELNSIELEGDRIVLLPVGEFGLDDFYEYSIVPEFYTHIEYDGFTTKEEVVKYLNNMIEKSKCADSQYWFIKLKDSGKIIGTFCALDYNPQRASVEIGYGLSPGYWGSGYFSETLDVALDYLFNRVAMHRIFAKTMGGNNSSINALKNKGFVIEGTGRDFYKYVGGDWVDACFLSLLYSEY